MHKLWNQVMAHVKYSTIVHCMTGHARLKSYYLCVLTIAAPRAKIVR